MLEKATYPSIGEAILYFTEDFSFKVSTCLSHTFSDFPKLSMIMPDAKAHRKEDFLSYICKQDKLDRTDIADPSGLTFPFAVSKRAVAQVFTFPGTKIRERVSIIL